MKKLIRQGEWDGREWKVWSGLIVELRKELPTFTIDDLRIGEGVNKYKCVIIRQPLEYSLGDARAEKNLPIPIDAVRKKYIGAEWQNFSKRTVQLGYELVQHQDLLDSVLKSLKEFSEAKKEYVGISRISPLKDSVNIEGTLETTTYGARMHLEFVVPNFKYDVDGVRYNLKVICRNSVDKRIAVSVTFFLCREPLSLLFQDEHKDEDEIQDIPFKAFYSTHKPEDLKDNAIEKAVYQTLHYIGIGKWSTETIDQGYVVEGIKSAVSNRIITEKKAQVILDYLKQKPKTIKLIDFHLKLTKLYITSDRSYFQEKQRENIFKLIDEVKKKVHEAYSV